MEVVTETEGSIAILTPTPAADEDLACASLSPVRDAVKSLTEKQVRKIIIDLRNVDFLGSADIAALVASARTIHSNAGLMVLCGCGLRLAETLAVVQLLRVLPIRLTRNQAVLALKKVQPGRDSSSDLVRGNPTMEKIRTWWDDVVQAQTREVRITPTAVELAPDPEPDMDAVGEEAFIRPGFINLYSEEDVNGVGQETDIAPLRHDLNDWVGALETLKSAQRLYASRGLKFSPDLTFKEFLGRLAESMIER
ncbi:MAG: hypothetical protein PWP23_2691 [Candidatus Sumerlaeota bacterium]|nr:hypothetical protein [Candidatus Sumerlaeota bacterium]